MSIEQLIYMIEVAKSKSLAAAAMNINISQSALSQAITKLETELNIKLFNRTTTGVIPTMEGDMIIEKAQHALDALLQIKKTAKQINNSSVSLRVSLIPGLMTPIVDTYLSFKEKGSHLKIEINEKASMEIIEDIKRDEIDAGFIAINKANSNLITGLEFIPVTEGKLLIYASIDSLLTHSKEVIPPAVLKEQLFVLYKDGYVQDFVTDFQRLYGPIDIFLKTTDLNVINKTIKDLGAITIGHDISTKFNHAILSTNQIKAVSTCDLFDTSFRFGWIKKFENKLSEEAKAYFDEVNKMLV